MTSRAYLSVGQVLSYLDRKKTSNPSRDEERRRQFRLAAAVLAGIRHPENLQPLTADGKPGEGLELLKGELVRATGRKFEGQVMLDLDTRRKALRELGKREAMLDALQANPTERTGPVQEQFERYLRNQAEPIVEQHAEDLSSTLQVLLWVTDILDGLPNIEDVRRQLGRQDLLAPFEAIAGDAIFRGRRDEMSRLRSYVGVLPPDSILKRIAEKAFGWLRPDMQPALSVSGPGGVGKSALIARFMLEHSRVPEEGRIPFGYLDFDRAGLNVSAPATLIIELLRQLDLEFPQQDSFRSLIRFLNKQSQGSDDAMMAASVNTPAAIRSIMADMLGTLQTVLGPRPYVVVLDTFEEVQYRGEAAAFPFWEVLIEMQKRWPFLRVVVSGRAPVTTLQLAGAAPVSLVLGDLDDEAALAFLRARGVEDPKLAKALVKQIGGVPLSLKLAAAVVKEGGADRGGVKDLSGRSAFWFSASDQVIQGQLYDRILGHIHDARVKKLAYPGLILRRISPDVILNILNEPCGLGLSSMAEAEEVFQALLKETALVTTQLSEGSVVHRADLRRMTLKLFVQRAPDQIAQIRRSAVSWYSKHRDWRSKAEEAYHRLQLGDFPDSIELSFPDVRSSLQASIAELPIAAQTYLASLGYQVAPEVLSQASQAQFEAHQASRVEEFLPYGEESVRQARKLVSLQKFEGHSSPLYRSLARVAMEEGHFSEALVPIEEGTSLALEEGDVATVLDLAVERVWALRHLERFEELPQAAQVLGQYAESQNKQVPLLLHRIVRWEFEDSQEAVGKPSMLLREIGERIRGSHLMDFWNLMPAFIKVIPALDRTLPDLGYVLRTKLFSNEGPFMRVKLPHSGAEAQLRRVMSFTYGNVGGDDQTADRDLLDSFLGLCREWPYRILAVQPPYGTESFDPSESAAFAA